MTGTGFSRFNFSGHPLGAAWRTIRTGELKPEGLKDELYRQYQEIAYPKHLSEDELESSEDRGLLFNHGMDFDIALVMVTRALGKSYSMNTLFEPGELPLNALEMASALLRDAKASGQLTTFEASTLMVHLAEVAEDAGRLIWEYMGYSGDN